MDRTTFESIIGYCFSTTADLEQRYAEIMRGVKSARIVDGDDTIDIWVRISRGGRDELQPISKETETTRKRFGI